MWLSYKTKRFIKIAKLLTSAGVIKPSQLNANAVWIDDWFTLEEINERTFIISEPRFFLRNNSYLIMGDEQAVLFDTGSGKRDLAPVVSSLTTLPLMVITSHTHSDHLGSVSHFENYTLTDLPINKKYTHNDVFAPSVLMYSNVTRRPKLKVSRWVKPGQPLDLGGRQLTVIPVPGHSPDSIALLDEDNKMLFVGDFVYQGNLIATWGGNLSDYLASTRTLISLTQGDESLFPAHYTTPLPRDILFELENALLRIINGKVPGRRYTITRKYPVTRNIGLITRKTLIRSAGRDLLSN